MQKIIEHAKQNGIKDAKYQEFTDKFKPKLTTDDCFTPENVYEAVKDWAVKEYGWEGRDIIRPFYPGGDYEREEYNGGVVIDNPPFSIISKIVSFYEEHGIDYFLFAHGLTILNIKKATSRIITSADIVYENGAKVNTSFVCSKGDKIRTAPDLQKKIEESQKQDKRCMPKYEYPVNVITIGRFKKWCNVGIEYRENNAFFIHALDDQKKHKKTIFGGGFIVPSENAKAAEARRHDAERAKAAEEEARAKEKLKNAFFWQLSEREQKIVDDIENAAKQH